MRLVNTAALLALAWIVPAHADLRAESEGRGSRAYRFPLSQEAVAVLEGGISVHAKSPLAVVGAGEAGVGPVVEAEAEMETTGGIARAVSEDELCETLASAAQAHDLPLPFFIRLIWQESRFDPLAVSRAGAQGVAQFMPRVAASLGLANPFDPIQALPVSARFLRTLYDQFGNLGLAAAAYNAGARRIQDWLAKRGKLPKETRDYVLNITGHAPERWVAARVGRTGTDLPRRAPCRHMVDSEVQVADASDTVPLPPQRPQLAQVAPRVHGVQIRQRVAQAAHAPMQAQAKPRPAPAPAAKPWGVQLAAHFSESKALQGFAGLREKHARVLGQRKPTVVRTRLAGKGAVLNRVQIAMDTRAAADQLCSQLKNAGGSCVVLRN